MFGYLAATALLLGACTAGVPAPVPPLPPSVPERPAPVGSPPAGAVGISPAAVPLAAFMTMTLTDVRSGERFTLSDFKGKVTIVEGMAVW